MIPKSWTLSLAGWLAALTLTLLAAAQTKPATTSGQPKTSPADRAAQKLAHLQRNSMQQKPDQTPTVLTDEELNAYFGPAPA